MKAEELYNNLLEWAKEYDIEFYNLLSENKEYSIKVLNIEREQKKPRKDFANYADVKKLNWYMFKKLFDEHKKEYQWQNIKNIEEIKTILNDYINNYYCVEDEKDTWFNKMKEVATKYGYAGNMKEYKENPNKFKGNITDIATIIRVGITTTSMTPDLYEILKILGKDELIKRINLI